MEIEGLNRYQRRHWRTLTGYNKGFSRLSEGKTHITVDHRWLDHALTVSYDPETHALTFYSRGVPPEGDEDEGLLGTAPYRRPERHPRGTWAGDAQLRESVVARQLTGFKGRTTIRSFWPQNVHKQPLRWAVYLFLRDIARGRR